MKKQARTKFISQASLIAIVFVFAAALQVGAFTEPASSPPAGNVSAPINVGSAAQNKNGWLGAVGLAATDGAILATAPGSTVAIGTLGVPLGTLDVEDITGANNAKICLNGVCATKIGGPTSFTCPVNQFVSGFNAAGGPVCTYPAAGALYWDGVHNTNNFTCDTGYHLSTVYHYETGNSNNANFVVCLKN